MKSQLKKERHETKIKMAAFHFLNTSRDGAVICNLCGIKPSVLHSICRDESGIWIEALQFWQRGYEGDGAIEGEFYFHAVGESSVSNDFKTARDLWKYLFTRPQANRLRWYFNDLDAYGNEVNKNDSE